MCGIVGQYIKNDYLGAESRLKKALSMLANRGPDDQGVVDYDVNNRRLSLGHRRLSIIDLTVAGHQPMVSNDGRYTIIFNGEIYNYIELRNDLIADGRFFTTNTDTEVLLESWSKWGIECLSRLDGMYSFVIYDKLLQHMSCVRDPFGIKPFYYSVIEGCLYFASEIQPLIHLIPRKLSVNIDRSYNYLMWGEYDNDHNTFYNGVYHLKPGYYISLDLNNEVEIKQMRWWWPDITERNDLTFSQASDELRNMFLQSVKKQLRSDVPIGSALSGGLDSSAIVCAIHYLEPDYPINTFSYAPKGFKYNEEKWVKYIVDYVGAISHYTDYNLSEMSSDFDDIIITQGEPFGSTSIAAQYRVYELARNNGITVTLDGQGADELLGGYDGYPSARIQSYIEQHNFSELFCFLYQWSRWPNRNTRKAILHLGDAVIPQRYRDIALSIIGLTPVPAWINEKYFKNNKLLLTSPGRYNQDVSANQRRLAERLRIALTSSKLPSLLRHGDRNSMRWSIESRVPFLTKSIAEFTLRLPERYLVSEKGETKYIFRNSMRGIVPSEIINRRDKVGFETPEHMILKNHIQVIKQWISIGSEIPFLNYDFLIKEIDDIINSRKIFSFRAWRIINYCRWLSLNSVIIHL